MPKHAGWFEILEAARGLEAPFTASDLASAAGLVQTKKSSSVQIAGAWLSKFEKWSYVERGDMVKPEKSKPIATWLVTQKGRDCKLQESLESRFERLLGAVKDYQESVGQGQSVETTAWKKLCKVASEVDLTSG